MLLVFGINNFKWYFQFRQNITSREGASNDWRVLKYLTPIFILQPIETMRVKICLTNGFHVAVRLFSNKSQMTSKCGKNKKVAHEAQPSVTDVLTTF